MDVTSRQRMIIERVQELGFMTVEALAGELDVSTQTIRREITFLDKKQMLTRYHGGVGLISGQRRLDYAEKKTTASSAKLAIAAAVSRLIPDGASVFLDVGTTVEAVAQALAARNALRVLTVSMPSAMILCTNRNNEVIVTGGVVAGPDGSLVGDLTRPALDMFKVDFGIFGCSGFEPDGTVMDYDVMKIGTKKAVMATCRTAILVADSSKFMRSALIRVAPLSAFHFLVCEKMPDRDSSAMLENDVTKIIQADFIS